MVIFSGILVGSRAHSKFDMSVALCIMMSGLVSLMIVVVSSMLLRSIFWNCMSGLCPRCAAPVLAEYIWRKAVSLLMSAAMIVLMFCVLAKSSSWCPPTSPKPIIITLLIENSFLDDRRWIFDKTF